MATRSNLQTKILEALTAWDSKEKDPAKIDEIAAELEVSDTEVFNALGELEEKGKVSGKGRGLTSVWWLGSAAETPAPTPAERVKRKRRTKAEMEAARAEERKRLEYAVRAAETQDEVMSQASDVIERTMDPVEEIVIPAETPVVAENGEKVTVPVDYDDESKGRRELDASRGERIISEDDMTALLKRVRARLADEKPLSPDQWAEVVTQTVCDDFGVTLHEPKNGDCPDNEIPPLPEGVHPHTWELAHDGNTQGARDYHMRAAERQMEEYKRVQEGMMDVPPF